MIKEFFCGVGYSLDLISKASDKLIEWIASSPYVKEIKINFILQPQITSYEELYLD